MLKYRTNFVLSLHGMLVYLRWEVLDSRCVSLFQIDQLIIYLKGLKGEATDLLEPVRFTTANIIASVLVNETYKWGDPDQLKVHVITSLNLLFISFAIPP